MGQKIKKGDYLKVVSDDNNSVLKTFKGKVLTAITDPVPDISGDEDLVKVATLDSTVIDNGSTGFRVSRFEILTEKEVKEIKNQPQELYIILKENCMNYVGQAKTYEQAVTNFKPSQGDTYLICKAEVVAKTTLKYDIEKVE